MADVGISQFPLIELDGSPLAAGVKGRIVNVVVDDHLVLPDTFTIMFADGDRKAADDSKAKIGTKVRIAAGKLGEDPQDTLIVGEITSLEAMLDRDGAYYLIRGYDHSHRLHRDRKTKTFQNVTDSSLANDIASAAGLQTGTIDSTSPTHEHVSQVNLTDWEFLKARGREIGYEVVVNEGKLNFRKPTSRQGSPVDLKLGDTLVEFRPRVTAMQQVGQIEVRGWDWKAKQKIVSTQDATTGSVTLDSGVTPASLADKFGSPKYVSCDRALSTVAEADAAAKATAEELASAAAEADGEVIGSPKLKAGAEVKITGVGAGFEGTWTLSRTRHVFDHAGYHTQIEVTGRQERSLLGLASMGATSGTASAAGPRVYGAVIGIVTDIQDPENVGRVKLAFPWLSDSYASDWTRVAYPGAGKERGVFSPHEVDDEVLVMFEHGDVRRPYVLGGLYNGTDSAVQPYYDSSAGKIDVRIWKSREGHLLELSDKQNGEHVRLDVGDGKYTLLLDKAANKVVIHSDGTIEITAKDKIKIDATGDLELHGKNVKVQADMGLELKGAQVTVSGNPIKLN